MMDRWVLTAVSPDETTACGRQLGERLQPGDVVLLVGPMGVGKTHFAKGVARGLDVMDEITSPTFTIVAEYEGRVPFAHMDLYRMYRNPDSSTETLTYAQLFDIGFEDYIDGEQVVLIEWPLGIRELLDDYLLVDISFLTPDEGSNEREARQIAVQAVGDRSAARLREWMAG
ncbi:tRNA (adenosine(37)-N6)-threonylcarbamoyltransferase complex ATPase subunit type 1 TsaE [Alicyclobacillus acidiphilus]|jgi:tRNA threonylcarbamoyladenosine biosynthesis protein TsaE|uniref:tRNA (adenosine(37)-N6)-threonylcarbamoyltransferase complex ATPase subunit type 1 TsaE n=1 Tax=Alicyclobacillus acidiphilus TaxID=182455 RepID=UPI00082D73D1|nr:tRNA (adenosine(37)-N6)-threonylcarbamoyltransferase complex ATPase subunit type 1 TsaE [Alicyclobacillus acidiphilus]